VHKLFKGGIHQIICNIGPSLWISSADGCIAKVNKKNMLFEEEVQLGGGPVTSLAKS